MSVSVVRIGSREIEVEQSPLRTSFVHSHSSFQFNRLNDGLVEIKYHRGIRVVAWILCVLGLPVLVLGLLLVLLALIVHFVKPEAANSFAGGLCLLWGVPIGLMGVWLLGPRYRFDTSVGELTVRHCWRTRRRPLAEIVAVQVINAGLFEGSSGEGGGETFSSYQMNLILVDRSEPRLFVAYNTDAADMGQKGKQLADFLQVPFLASPKFALKNQRG